MSHFASFDFAPTVSTYDGRQSHSIQIDVLGVECLCLDLDTLIHVKRAAGRPKDFEAIAELESLREEQRKQ